MESSKSLQPYKQQSQSLPITSMTDLATAGDLIAKSGMLGARNPAEGFLIVATCHQEGISFLKFRECYHVIMGQIAMKSEAMLANLLELGGEYQIIERNPDIASVKLKFGKAEYVSTLKWEDVKEESYTKAKNGELKDNWSTPRRRMQMMWARVVSDGVRAVCPLATRGTYTPEEVMDFDEPGKMKNITHVATDNPIVVEPSTPTPKSKTSVDESDMPETIVEEPPQMPQMQMPQMQMPQMPQNPQPTTSADIVGPDDLDYTICKANGAMNGIKWEEMDTHVLKMALDISNPNIYKQDKDAIFDILMARDNK